MTPYSPSPPPTKPTTNLRPKLPPAQPLMPMEVEVESPPPGSDKGGLELGGPHTALSPSFVEGEHRVIVHTIEGQVRRWFPIWTVRRCFRAAATIISPSAGFWLPGFST